MCAPRQLSQSTSGLLRLYSRLSVSIFAVRCGWLASLALLQSHSTAIDVNTPLLFEHTALFLTVRPNMHQPCNALVFTDFNTAARGILPQLSCLPSWKFDVYFLAVLIAQGSARVIRCLTNSRDKLSPVCRATLFDEEVRFSENIDFQYPMKNACTREIGQYCKGIPHGDAKVIRCAVNVCGFAVAVGETALPLVKLVHVVCYEFAMCCSVWVLDQGPQFFFRAPDNWILANVHKTSRLVQVGS